MAIIAGVDEVGRGPLAGPVVTAAVIFPDDYEQFPIIGLRDSKKLSPKKREELDILIRERALCFAFGRAESWEIDELNILEATMLAMIRAISHLKIKPDKILIDGNKAPNIRDIPIETIIKGDDLIPEISAASIIAKVKRDHEMNVYHEFYPEYDFLKNKGYGTAKHLEALQKFGLTSLHRKSFLKNI